MPDSCKEYVKYKGELHPYQTIKTYGNENKIYNCIQ